MSEQLINAVLNEDCDLVEKILKSGVNPNEQNSAGETALFFLRTHTGPHLLKLFLNYNADISIRNNQGELCIFRHKFLYDMSILNLIESKLDLRITNNDSKNLLMKLAIDVDNFDDYYLGRPHLYNSDFSNPNFISLEQFNEILLFLLRFLDINATDINGRTAIHHFCLSSVYKRLDKESSDAYLQALLVKGSNIHLVDNYGNTALHLLVRYVDVSDKYYWLFGYYVDIAVFLIRNKVDPTLLNNENKTFWDQGLAIITSSYGIARSNWMDTFSYCRRKLIKTYKNICNSEESEIKNKVVVYEASNILISLPQELIDLISNLAKDDCTDEYISSIFYKNLYINELEDNDVDDDDF